MKQLVLQRTPVNWLVAAYVDGAPDPDLARLRGDHLVELPYPVSNEPAEMWRVLQRANPDAVVTVRL